MTYPSVTETNYRILVVDDNRAIHEDLRKILIGNTEADSGLLADETLLFDAPAAHDVTTQFEIDSAYQGQEGLTRVQTRLAENRPYAVAFVDVRMPPGWDGVETITHLWRVDPDLQIVICTAYSDYSWKEIQAKLGHSDNLLILKKPFDSIEVIQLAHALTHKWSAGRVASAKLADLDLMVARRTADLQAMNAALKKEVADRAKAEEAFRIIFDASPIGIALLDQNFRFVAANRSMQDMHGLAKEGIIGNDPLELEWFQSRHEMETLIGGDAPSDRIDQHEATLRHVQFGVRTGLLWVRHVEIRNIRHALCFLLDITERKEMEQELRRAKIDAEAAAKAKSAFLANMSHEIRTPLNGVLGLSSFLEEESLPKEIRELGKLIRTSGEMLRGVLDDVLDFSKIESGKLELENEIFSLRESLEWSTGIFRQAALEKNLQLRFTLEDGVPAYVRGDATRLRQVLTNLISNAIKFTASGSVEVSVSVDKSAKDAHFCSLRMAVADTGIGIPEDGRHRLFQSFSQVDASTNRRFGGTGLGLAISKRLVEMMGGTISFSSEFGVGTTFVFTVPVTIARPAAKLTSDAIQATSQKQLLVVEDNVINRKVITRMLENMGHRVQIAEDGEAALRRLEEMPYDLVLMDVNMPGLDGLEATRRIRSLRTPAANIPVIGVTASAMMDDRQNCLDSGMNDYVTKPITVESLKAVIDRWAPGTAPGEGELYCRLSGATNAHVQVTV